MKDMEKYFHLKSRLLFQETFSNMEEKKIDRTALLEVV